jgi:hypothetical protein
MKNLLISLPNVKFYVERYRCDTIEEGESFQSHTYLVLYHII